MRHPLTLILAGLACLAALVVVAACGGHGGIHAAASAPARPTAPATARAAAPRALDHSRRATAPTQAKPTTTTKARAKAKAAAAAKTTATPTPRTRGIQRSHSQPLPVLPKPSVPAPKPVRITPLPSVAPPLLLGFQDDVGFRWSSGRQALLDKAADAGVSVIRTTVNWSEIAPTRPANARNPFDPSYRFDDLDELAQNAQRRGIQLLLTIWGTPAWADGGAGANHAPTHAADLGDFARALANRYSGLHAGYPYEGLYSIWNEPNLAQFLSPQFDASGRPVAPHAYATLYRAAYAGIKASNPKALVAIGETSPRGRDTVTTSGVQQTESPGRFAQLLSRERPRLSFDAWAHHPYPTAPNLPPSQVARWPNVTLSQLPRFEAALRTWFGRSDVPIWITEYAYQTKPYRFGVSFPRQADYLRQVLATTQRESWVRMFIWFTFRDSSGNPWRSGLVAENGTPKPALTAFTDIAWGVRARNSTAGISSRLAFQQISVPALNIAYFSGAGATVGVYYRLLRNGRTVAKGQTGARIQLDGTLAIRLGFRPRAGSRYVLRLTGSDVHGNKLAQTQTLIATR